MKSEHWKLLCRTRPKYFEAWEASQGPGQQSKNASSIPPEAALARLAICRRPCPQYRREEQIREYCTLDVRPRADGAECKGHALACFAPRAMGYLPPCPLWRSPVDAPPRIGLLTPCFYTGGGEQWMLTLADHAGWTFSGCAAPSATHCQPEVTAEFARRMPVYGTAQADCRRLVFESDLIIAWGQLDYPRLLEGFRGPVIFVSHGSDVQWTRQAILAAIGSATHWVAVSEAARRPTAGLVPADRLTVICNGVDAAHYLPTRPRGKTRAEIGIAPGEMAVGYLGRFSGEKRWGLWTEGVALLPANYRAVYCGCGHEEQQLRALAAKLLGNRAIFSRRSARWVTCWRPSMSSCRPRSTRAFRWPSPRPWALACPW